MLHSIYHIKYYIYLFTVTYIFTGYHLKYYFYVTNHKPNRHMNLYPWSTTVFASSSIIHFVIEIQGWCFELPKWGSHVCETQPTYTVEAISRWGATEEYLSSCPKWSNHIWPLNTNGFRLVARFGSRSFEKKSSASCDSPEAGLKLLVLFSMSTTMKQSCR